MIVRISLLVVSIFCFSLFFSSCNTGSENKSLTFSPRQNKISILAGCKKKEWKVEKYFINGEDVLAKLKDCEKDNLDVYFTDHRGESMEGKTKCKHYSPMVTETGYWYFNEDTTEIEVTIGYDFYILKLIELSSDKFHYISITNTDTIETILSPNVI